MVYSLDEKYKLDLLFTAFGDYINEHTYFDIVWSDKLGYLRIVPDEREDVVMRIENFEAAATMLFWDFYADCEETSPDSPDVSSVLDRISTYMTRLPELERTFCEELLQKTIRQWNS